MPRRHAPTAALLAAPLLAVLRRALPPRATVLELGSGPGEHAARFAAELPGVTWQPSDPDPESRESAAAWAAEVGAGNVLAPLDLDLLAPTWRLRSADAIVCVNVLHAAPAGALEALVAGAAAVLPRGGPLVVAGLFRRRSAPLPAALAPVEAALAAPGAPGLPEAEALLEAAARHGLALDEATPLPSGCACLVLRRA